MSDLQIIIRGLALCHPVASVADPMTEILFPHAPEHTLKLTIDNGVETISEDFFPQGFMTMKAGKEVGRAPAGGVNNLIDLSELHKGLPANIALKARGDVKRRMSVSYLSVPTATLTSQTNAGRDFEIWAKKFGGGLKNPARTFIQIAPNGLDEEVVMSFNIPAASSTVDPALTLEIEQPFGHSYTFRHAVDPANPLNVLNYKLTFDNHCNGLGCGGGGGSDFGYYYEMLEAVDNATGEHYEIEEFPAERIGMIQPDSEAACNPVMGDPNESMASWHKH
jgi:hypothetical protein